MTEFVQYALLGLGAGAMYVLLAQGVVLIFRGSGVLNLAQGAIAMLAAYQFNQLRMESAWPIGQALVVVVLGAALIGLLMDVLLMRSLRRASPLARLIATLGVLIVASSFAILHWGATPQIVVPIITPEEVHILGAVVPSDRLWMLAVAVVITGVLAAVWRFTRAGWIAEAVSESEQGAAALGWSPQIVSAATWAAGGALAGLAGVLISPITQLNQAGLTFLIIPALAATLIGGFRSFGLTLVGGVAIGMAQSLTGNYIDIEGAPDALPFLVIVVMLIVRGSPLPLRDHVLDRMPRVGLGRVDIRVVALAAAAAGLLVALISARDVQAMLATTFATAIVLLSLVVLIGYAGQLSLAQYTLAGLGALVAARLVAAQGWPFELSLVAGVVAAVGFGLLFALPALRTRGVNLAVVTLGLGLAAQSTVFNNPELTGGITGTNVGSQTFFGLSIDPIGHPTRYTLVVLLFFVLAAVVVANVRRSRTGRTFLALRANERAAASVGINVFAAKLFAFAISGALAGLGGILYGFQSTTVTFTTFGPLESINAVAQAVIGGIGFVFGAVFGALLSPQSLSSLIESESVQRYLPLIGGVGVLLTLISYPDGIAAVTVKPLRRLATLVRLRPAGVEGQALEARAIEPCRPRTLHVEKVSVRYGGVVAVDEVSFTVLPGQIVALIGPNGAGKTSLMDALTGFAPCTGSARLDDTPIGQLSPHRRTAAGIVRSWQGLELFEDLTVLENLQAASDRGGSALSLLRDLVRPAQRPLCPAALAAVREFDLSEHLHRYPDELSYGLRRLVGIARAIATEPSVLLLDEPAAGLDEFESGELATLVRNLAEKGGMAILVIEHDMDIVMSIADHVVVMDFGRQIAAGPPQEISQNPAAVASYLGEETIEEEARVGA